MKISKLFHWLYAILMFLPIMVFIPNAFYYGFNEQAVAQEKTEQVPIYYESNEVNELADLVPNHIYYYSNNLSNISESTGYNYLCYLVNTETLRAINVPATATSVSLYFGPTGELTLTYRYNNTDYYNNVLHKPFYFVISSFRTQSNYFNYIIDKISYTDYKLETGEYKPVITNMSITDSMSYAWVSTWQNELFSWSYDSFLTQPFLYITNLFNVPATNTLLYCLSYWLNISIIWLCFDVVMYVPLLVHRWLDKGIVE